ncbi:MAG: LamG-like jellyroll fold domain-containing protein [Bacteroidota bacterium]
MKNFIKKSATALLFSLVLLVTEAAASIHITVDTTWSGTVNISTEIYIDNGATLTILPGTNVIFTGHIGLQVQGRLLAVGTRTDSIKFFPAVDSTGWDGILFDGTPSTNDTSKITYCVISYSKANTNYYHNSWGGAIALWDFSQLMITNCNFHHNEADYSGGAIYCNGANPVIRNNIFANNSASNGGAIALESSTPLITDNLFINNSTGGNGGGIYFDNSSPQVTNNTFSGNHAGYSGGAVFIDYHSGPVFTNCIFYNDVSTRGSEVAISDNGYNVDFYYCLVEGGIAGFGGLGGSGKVGNYVNNLNTNPLFTGSGNHPYSPQPSSPCVNSGKPDMTGLDVPELDLAGNPRIKTICYDRIDMGAYEYQEIQKFSFSGAVTANTYWCADTANITGNVTINNGVTLTIGKGVLVNFLGNYLFAVNGRIQAEGDSENYITFKTAAQWPGWGGMTFSNVAATNDTSRLSFCKFQYGNAPNRGDNFNGGAVYVNNFNKLVISDCIFSQNFATNEGGALYLTSSHQTFRNCQFTGNEAKIGGAISGHNSTINMYGNALTYNRTNQGDCSYPASAAPGVAIYLNTCTANITGNSIEHNQAQCMGGGIYATSSTLTLNNDTISYNTAENCFGQGGGGGMALNASTVAITENYFAHNNGSWGGGLFLTGVGGEISHNTITQNGTSVSGCSISVGGGIVFGSGSNPVFSYNTVTNNSAAYSAGIDLNYSSPSMIQNLIANNNAGTASGGVGFTSSSPLMLNNTIWNNTGENFAGGLGLEANSNPIIRSNIIYGNHAVHYGGNQVYLYDNTSNPNFYYCDIEGGKTGFGGNNTNYSGVYQNNINSDPLFVSAGNFPYQILPTSPCLNTGDPATTTGAVGINDLAGNPRIQNGRIEMGAYETERGEELFAGSAIHFTQANDSIILDNESHFIFANTFTVEFWLKADSMSAGYHSIIKKGGEWEVQLFYDEAISILEFGINQNSVFGYYQTTGAFLVNHWNHIAAVFNLTPGNAYVTIYINGQPGISDVAETIVHNNMPVTIGSGILGQMDELRIWQTARTVDQIREDMHLMIPVNQTGLVAYHQFDGISGTSVVDYAGGNNGTLCNMNVPGCLVPSTVPASTGMSARQIVSAIGNVTFTGTDLAMNISSISSTDTIVVSRLDTLPNLNPPDANKVFSQYWIVETYGGGAVIADMTFHVLQEITSGDETNLTSNRLYQRGSNSDSSWTFVENSLSASVSNNTVTFGDIDQFSQFCVPHKLIPDPYAGDALLFNGTSQYVQIDPLYNSAPPALTVEAWVYPDNLNNSSILYHGDNGEFNFVIVGNKFGFGVKLSNNNWYTVYSPAPEINTWQHLCGVWENSGSLKIFVNGSLMQTLQIPALPLFDPGSGYLPSIGAFNRQSSFYNGRLDEIRVWNVARTIQQVRENMHLTLSEGDTGLIGYWQFNDGSGNHMEDHGGNHDGILQNMNNSNWAPSSIPAGGGTSVTKIIASTGAVDFSGTGIQMNLTQKIGTDTIVVTRIDTNANILPVVDTSYAPEYWVVHKYGSGSLNADLQFAVGGDVTAYDASHLQRIALLKRPGASEDNWIFCAHADNANAVENNISFHGISGFSQFSIGKGLIAKIVLNPDSVIFSRTPSTLEIADSVLISNPGTDSLMISGISHTCSQFTLSFTQMTIHSGEQKYLKVIYHPNSDGMVYDTLRVASNDPANPVAKINVRAEGFVISVIPGTALHYDGSSKYVEVADNNSLDLTNNYTIEAWINPEGFNGLGGIVCKYQTSGANGYYLRLTGASPYTGLNFDGVSTAPGILQAGKWYHIAAVNNNGTRIIYVNGVSQTLTGTADVISSNSDPLSIGVDYLSGPRYFKGKIDEVRIWNVVRSEQEIRENIHLTLKGNDTGLVSYWQFNEGAGTVTADKIHGNNGSLHYFIPSDWNKSTIPAGGGSSFTNEVNGAGLVAFPGTGISMNFTAKTGSDQVVVSRIDSMPNINPTGQNWPFERQYWAVHQYGCGTFNANLVFTTKEDLTGSDATNPSSIALYSRNNTSDSNWIFLDSAALVNASTNQANFNGISGFSQFMVCRKFPRPDNYPGTAIKFNGANNNISGTGIDSTMTAITIEAWVYHNSLPGFVQRYVSINPEVAVLRFDGTIYGGYHELHFYIKKANGSGYGLRVDSVLTTDEWMHIAGTYNGTVMKLYLNGKLIKSASTTGGLYPPNGNFQFSHSTESMNGKIDEVRIWNYARTAEEIRENMCLVLSGHEAGLKNYWQFNEGSGLTVIDVAGGLTGTLANISGDEWIGSTIPFGAGVSNSQIIGSTGAVNFPLTGIGMNFISKTGIDSISVTRIDTTANIIPDGIYKVFDSQYWVVNKYGTGAFNANLTFTLNEDLTTYDQNNPSVIKLYTRGGTADTIWSLAESATVVNAAANQVTFNGITGFSQFIIGKDLSVTENLTITNATIPFGEVACFNAFNAISVSDLTVETGGEATMIAGASIHLIPGIHVNPGGKLHGYITSTAEYCPVETRSESAVISGANETLFETEKSWFKLYPNPTSGAFTLELSDMENPAQAQVEIFGSHGEKILKTVMCKEKRSTFSIESSPAGIYYIRISARDKSATGKLVKM